MQVIDNIRRLPDAPILDAGCGYGRNALALATRGLSVVCVDRELMRLDMLRCFASKHPTDLRESECRLGQLYSVLSRLDATNWPFVDNCFAVIICVHFLDIALLQSFRSSLMTGGYLYIETFGGHGENYLALPKARQLHHLLRPGFDLPFYCEKKVGPSGYDAATVKLLGRKR
jgi:SAM-dependent methyltransferase